MTTGSDDLHVLLGAYVLGGLSDDDHRAFSEHLRSCRQCQTEARPGLGAAAPARPRRSRGRPAPQRRARRRARAAADRPRRRAPRHPARRGRSTTPPPAGVALRRGRRGRGRHLRRRRVARSAPAVSGHPDAADDARRRGRRRGQPGPDRHRPRDAWLGHAGSTSTARTCRPMASSPSGSSTGAARRRRPPRGAPRPPATPA